ncbi:histidine phosphatase family protein [Aestuariibius sp. HNIBRBA575]|uniref:histidine phosphatase family protein n=1 Tax=Aestuariibius sp. HNIBRBA575 TaxID=3233343 RepID=UPI0034A4A147
MTQWHWVRHGPTHEKNFVGWRDVPADLSNTDQISRLGSYLPQAAYVLSSDLIRASDTAKAIQGTRQNLGVFADIREFNFGAWDGLHFSEVAERDPDLSRQFWEQPGDLAAPDGESWNAVANRVGQFVDKMNALHPNNVFIAVAHIGVIMTQIQRASGSTAYQAMGHVIDNLSVTDMEFDGQNWRMGRINHRP